MYCLSTIFLICNHILCIMIDNIAKTDYNRQENNTTNEDLTIPANPTLPNELNNTLTNRVPSNLIPTTYKSMTDEWSKQTYKYFHCFDQSILTVAYADTKDLELWKKAALEIQCEIKRFGVTETVKRICANMEKRGIKLPKSSNTPTCIDDVFAVFSNKEWYKNNTTQARELIYRYCWGNFKNGNDEWIHDHVSDWLEKKGLTVFYVRTKIGSPDEGNVQRNNRKNFVYTNFCKKICTLLSDRIISSMKRCHGEYLCTRIKPNNTFLYQRIDHVGGKCYIVTPTLYKNMSNEVIKRKIQELMKTIDAFPDKNYAFDELDAQINQRTKIYKQIRKPVSLEGKEIMTKGMSFTTIC